MLAAVVVDPVLAVGLRAELAAVAGEAPAAVAAPEISRRVLGDGEEGGEGEGGRGQKLTDFGAGSDANHTSVLLVGRYW